MNNHNADTYDKLRKEWSSSLVRTMAENTLGKVCYNCGCSDNTELHHIVPLKLGGTNRLSNIAVLCHKCHMAAHHGRHILDYCNKNLDGRPHNVPVEDIDSALSDYTTGVIGAKECKKRMGLSDKSHISDMTYYKTFLKNRNIKSVRNNIDLIMSKRGEIHNGVCIGHIVYIDGKKKALYFAV